MQTVSSISSIGGCPECGGATMLNVHRTHFGVCERHKVRWLIGSNLFSGWHSETPEVWKENEAQLEQYTEVEPVYSQDE
jgi:hypothetical protein